MQNKKRLVQIFEDEPHRWGLRGDAYLWAELKDRLGDLPYPDTQEDLMTLLEQTYEQLTGRSIKAQGHVHVERYSHGGMSSGFIAAEFWAETGFPLLQARYLETR